MFDNPLLRQQHDLQIEASEVVEELRLDSILSSVGEPIRVGSSALGLMVWRDIDITVVCPTLNIDEISKLASQVMIQRGVRELRFLNDSGNLKADPQYPDGLYFGIKYKSHKGADWKLDIWFIDEPEQQPDLHHLTTIPNRLTLELRESILKIKSIWATHEEYGKTVKSYDIYTAVLEDFVRTPPQFEEWLGHKSR